MPLIDCGIYTQEGTPDIARLLGLEPSVQATVCGHEIPAAPDTSNTRTVPALIDTGAHQSCIDAHLAIDLGLKPIDKVIISGAGGAKEHNVYLAHVIIPQIDIVQYGRFAGVDLKAGGQVHEVLLGRTFLDGCIMIYDGIRAQVTLAAPKKP